MSELSQSLASWRRFTEAAEPPEPVSRGIDRAADFHRQHLERSGRLILENLAAHDEFCKAIEAYVTEHAGDRSEEHQQRVADFAAYLLRVYENTNSQSLGHAVSGR